MAMNLPGGLAKYADMIISVAGKNIAVRDMVYVSQEDLYSKCCFVFGTVSQIVTANQLVRLFQKKPGDVGQGFSVPLTLSETNNANGERFQGNDAYLVTHIGFEWQMLTSAADPTPISLYADVDTATTGLPLIASDLLALGLGFFWQLMIGSGPDRVMGNILSWPYGSGVYTAGLGGSIGAATLADSVPSNGGPNCPMRELGEPFLFPPNCDVVIKVGNKTAVKIQDTGAETPKQVISLMANARGYRLTLPAG